MTRSGLCMRVALLALGTVSLGCAAPRALSARLAEVERLAREGREHGAYRCAPEELALAHAHLEFAHLELAQGDLARAREHLVIADANARAAVRLSAEPSCAQVDADAPEARGPSLSVEPTAERSTYGHVRT